MLQWFITRLHEHAGLHSCWRVAKKEAGIHRKEIGGIVFVFPKTLVWVLSFVWWLEHELCRTLWHFTKAVFDSNGSCCNSEQKGYSLLVGRQWSFIQLDTHFSISTRFYQGMLALLMTGILCFGQRYLVPAKRTWTDHTCVWSKH